MADLYVFSRVFNSLTSEPLLLWIYDMFPASLLLICSPSSLTWTTLKWHADTNPCDGSSGLLAEPLQRPPDTQRGQGTCRWHPEGRLEQQSSPILQKWQRVSQQLPTAAFLLGRAFGGVTVLRAVSIHLWNDGAVPCSLQRDAGSPAASF